MTVQKGLSRLAAAAIADNLRAVFAPLADYPPTTPDEEANIDALAAGPDMTPPATPVQTMSYAQCVLERGRQKHSVSRPSFKPAS